jgi:hypothetical protein
MNMTDSNKQKAAAIFTAAADGKTIQWNNDELGWVKCDPFAPGEIRNVVNAPQFYRIKPKLVTRLWSRPEHVPGPVCWIRQKSSPDFQAMIVGTSPYGLDVVACPHNLEPKTYLRIRKWSDLTDREYSTDRKTWQPCVVTEAQQ